MTKLTREQIMQMDGKPEHIEVVADIVITDDEIANGLWKEGKFVFTEE